MSLAFSMTAQVKVHADGDTKIGTTGTNPAVGAKLHVQGGNSIFETNRVGIGTKTPARQLHLSGTGSLMRIDRKGASAPAFFLVNMDAAGAVEKNYIFGNSTSFNPNGVFYIGDYGTNVSGANTRRFVIDDDGDVIIGSTTSITGFKLRVEGSALKTDGLSDWNVMSDMRTKSNVKEYKAGLNELLKINTISYEYNGKGGTEKGAKRVGVSAQELQKIFPSMVEEMEYIYDSGLENVDEGAEIDTKVTKEKYLTINTSEMQWVLVNSIKEQQNMIDSQREEIEELKDLVAVLLDRDAGNNESISIEGDDSFMLSDNIPNPFSTSTVIKYQVQEDSNYAEIVFTDITGKTLERRQLNIGKGQIEVNMSNLPSGVYNYSLLIDNEIKSTKRMVFNK